MKNKAQNAFQNKFNQYLSKRITQKEKNQIFKGEFDQKQQKSSRPNGHLFQFESPVRRQKLQEKPHNIQSSNQGYHNFQHEDVETCSPKKKSKRELQSIQLKRLKKMREIEENVCAICLDQIQGRSQMQCNHGFCNQCLKQWLNSSNNCPICRKQSRHYWHRGEKIKITLIKRPSEQIQMQFQQEQRDESLDYLCYNCDNTQLGDVVLICDRCELNSCHVECDESLRGREPKGDWFCHFCRT